MFRKTFGMYGRQYFNKVRNSCMQVAKILFTFVLWNLSDNDKWQKRYKLP